jgi:hypothetical protein
MVYGNDFMRPIDISPAIEKWKEQKRMVPISVDDDLWRYVPDRPEISKDEGWKITQLVQSPNDRFPAERYGDEPHPDSVVVEFVCVKTRDELIPSAPQAGDEHHPPTRASEAAGEIKHNDFLAGNYTSAAH